MISEIIWRMAIRIAAGGAVFGFLYGGMSSFLPLLLNNPGSEGVSGARAFFLLLGWPVGTGVGAFAGFLVGMIDGCILAAIVIAELGHPFKNAQHSTLRRAGAVLVIACLGFVVSAVVAPLTQLAYFSYVWDRVPGILAAGWAGWIANRMMTRRSGPILRTH